MIKAPKFLRRAERNVRRLQHAMDRKDERVCQQGESAGQGGPRARRAADSRRDFHHKLSTKIARDNQAVYVEDLYVRPRPDPARRVAHDAGWSAFTAMLEYKTKRYGRYLGKIGRFIPSTAPCSACGWRPCCRSRPSCSG